MADNYTNTDVLVFYYLTKKGYQTAATEMARAADPTTQRVLENFYDSEKLKSQRDQLSVMDLEERVQRIFFEASPLMDSFTELCAWIDDLGLDVYRFELSRILYPLFVHILLDARARGAEGGPLGEGRKEGSPARESSQAPREGSLAEGDDTAARQDERDARQQGQIGRYAQFLDLHRPRFTSFLGRPCRARTAEIDAVAKAALSGTLDTDPYLSALRGVRPSLVLNEEALELLRTHLVERRALDLLNLLTSRLHLAGDAGSPPMRLEDVDPEGEDRPLGSEQQEDAVALEAVNRGRLTLGLLEGNLEDRLKQRQRLERQQEEAAREAAEKVRKAAAAAAEGGAAAEGAAAAVLEDAAKKAEGAAPAAPSRVAPPPSKKSKVEGGRGRGRGDDELPERMRPEIPLPEVDPDWEGSVVDEMKARVMPSRDDLPSCCFMTFVNTNHGLTCADINPDASQLAAGFDDSTVRLVDLAKGRGPRQRRIEAIEGSSGIRGRDVEATSILRGHTGSVHSVSLSPDGSSLLSAGADGTVRLYSTELRANLAAYRGPSVPVWDVAYAPVGTYFASAHADRTVRVYNVEYPRAVRIFTGHASDVEVVAWHPNCHYVASGSSDRTVRLWDMRSGACARVLSGLRDPVTALAASPNGRLLVGASEEGRVVVWDLAEARVVGNLQGHSGAVWTLAFAHGHANPMLASGGADASVRLWDLKAASERMAGNEGAPDPLVTAWVTRATPVLKLRWTHRNLLMGSGAVTLRRKGLASLDGQMGAGVANGGGPATGVSTGMP